MTVKSIEKRIAAIRAATKAMVSPVVILNKLESGEWEASDTHKRYKDLEQAKAEIERHGTETIIIIDV